MSAVRLGPVMHTKFEPRVTSGFSFRRVHPVLRTARAHRGVDYGAPRGAPVLAVASGTVVRAGWTGGGGNSVYIRHDNGYETRYLHFSRIAPGIRAGVRVAQGEVIGSVGSTGLSTAPHLHYELSDIDESFATVPLGISDAHVGLNPTAVDPWRRDLASWGIREGFFVLPEPRADLVFVVGVALLALLSQIRRVRAVSAARRRRTSN